MSWELASGFFSGTLSVPIIWVEPDSVVTWGTIMSIWCQGIFETLEYHLVKEGSRSPLYIRLHWSTKTRSNLPSHSHRIDLCFCPCGADTLLEKTDKRHLSGCHRQPLCAVINKPELTSRTLVRVPAEKSVHGGGF